MLSRIPYWAVAVAGTLIVIIATAISILLLQQTRVDIGVVQKDIAEIRLTVDRLWSNHLQADQRSATADVLFALALPPYSHQSFLLKQAGDQLGGAVLSMWVASGQEVPDETPAKIETFKKQLRDGDNQGYESLKSEINQLRLKSAIYLNDLANKIRAKETRIESLQMRESWIYWIYMFFNLFGLFVAMCKELPVWRIDHRGEKAT